MSLPHWNRYRIRAHAEIRWRQRALPQLDTPIDLRQAVSQSRFWGRWHHLYVHTWRDYAFLFYWHEPWPTDKPAPAILTTVWPIRWVEQKVLRSPEGA